MSKITQWIMADAGLKDEGSLRFVLGKPASFSAGRVFKYILVAVAYIGLLIAGASLLGAVSGTPSAVVYQALYIPSVLAQALVSAAVFGLTIHTVHTLRRKQTWDSLRATAGGSGAAIRAAWAAAVYYRLGGMLAVLVYAPRIVLLGFLLWDLTAFNGDYLTLIAGGHQPSITPPFELLLFGAYVAAAFLLPLSALGLEAAVGLLLSTFARSRQTASLFQIVLTVARVGWSLIPVALFASLTTEAVGGASLDGIPFILLLMNGTAGDWGLGMMHAATVDGIWANVPYSAYIGVALLGVVLLHSGLTALVLRWAARRAQNID